jgi:hypothetical protein
MGLFEGHQFSQFLKAAVKLVLVSGWPLLPLKQPEFARNQ